MTKKPKDMPPKAQKKAAAPKSAGKKSAPSLDVSTELPASGQTELGRELAPLNALKRYIVNYGHLMHEDVHHFVQEGISDSSAFYGITHALNDSFNNAVMNQSMDQINTDPLVQNIANFLSSAAAFFLMYSLWLQREEKKSGWVNALRMWAEYENGKKNDEFGPTYEERKKKALERLGEKIAHSGLQFTQLPSGQAFVSEFNKEKDAYRQIVKRRKLNPEIPSSSILKSVQTFLHHPIKEKLTVSGMASWELYKKTMSTMKFTNSFIWDNGKEISNNIFTAHETVPDVANGYRSANALGHRERELKTQAKELAEKIINNSASKEDLQLFSRKTLTDTSHQISEEDRQKVLEILRDIEIYKSEAKRTRVSLYVQSFFMATQAVQGVVNAIKGDHYAAGFNAASVLAATGPLRGFASELTRKLGKIETSRAEKAQDLARIFQIHLPDEKSSDPVIEPA
jgi:hypothetical protein